MTPAWLQNWLGSPLDALTVEQLNLAIDGARQILDRLTREQDKPITAKGHQDLASVRAEWQEALAQLLKARAERDAPISRP